jgi:hypothetical protein
MVMIEDIEGEGQEPVGDTSPSSEPSSDPAEDLSSDIRKAVETQRERGPDGKFVKGADKGGADKGVSTGAAADKSVSRAVGAGAGAGIEGHGDKGAEAPKPGSAPGYAPPPGFSVATKQAWDTLPDHVKADIARRESEITSGMQRYGGLRNFAEEAERNGTTLQNAVSDYVAVETELKKDPVRGVEFLFQRMGVNPLAVLNQWVKRYMGTQGGGGQAQPAPQQLRIDPNAIARQAADTIRAEMQQSQIHNDIASFSADTANRFFANVRQDMAILVQSGKASDLQEAYEAACWLNPEIRAILVGEMRGGQDRTATRTAARAQNAAKAVTGAPLTSHSGDAPKRRDLSIDDEIREAIKAQRGAA